MRNTVEKIDFVVLWVDGNDQQWQKEKEKCITTTQDDDRIHRYRDWDNLKYWFRGVEKYAGWVNNVYFVTYGHLPSWLNVNNSKLKIIKHEDFIPKEYLPTFNSNSIELNIHRIKGLNEKFVLFNDDVFVISPTKDTDFFKDGLPCDSAALNVHCVNSNVGFNYAMYQAIGIVNKYFDFHTSIKKNIKKWITYKNGKYLWRTLYLLPCPRFPGIYQPHLANSFLKETFDTLWNLEGDILDETCRHRIRNKLDYSQWTMRNYQIANGRFESRPMRIGSNFLLEGRENNLLEACDYIKKQKGKMISISDEEMTDAEFERNKKKINEAFDSILPKKSSFEI